MAVRQDKVQISIAFLTDESKAFAKMVEENKKFITDIQKARKEGKDLTDIIQKMTASGKEIARIPLDKLAPSQLILRAQQLKQVLDLIPRSAPEYKQLQAEYKKINDQLATMRAETKGVSQAMNEARTDQGAFFNGMAAMVGKAMVLWYGLKNLVSSLFKPSQLASEMEQALISFETMLGSARNARKLVNEIVQLAASTPFETAELTDYVKRLLAMGIESTKVIGNLRQLGDIAAGVGKEKLPQIVLAFGQVAAKTKLAGGELKQFTEAGVPLVAELAKVMGVAESKIFDMVSAGQIGFKEVEKAIANMTSEGGKFAGLMGKQAQTTEGLMSTLKDNISLTLSAFGDGFNQAYKDILRSTIAFTNGLDRDKIREWGVAVGNAVKFLVDFTPALMRVLAVYAAYRVAVLAAETAQNLFNTAVKFNPYGLIAAGAVVAIQAMVALYGKLTEVAAAQQAVNDATIEAAKSSREQLQASTDLFAVLKDGTATYDQKRAAVQRILEQYPQYLGDIQTEKDLLANLEKAQNLVNQRILEEGLARTKATKIQEYANQLLEKRLRLAKAESEAGGVVVKEDGSTEVVNAVADGIRTDIAEMEAEMVKFSKSFDKEALSVVKTMASTIRPSFSALDTEISQLNEQLKNATNNPQLKATIEARLKELQNQRKRQFDDIVRGESKSKAQILEVDEKDAEKRQKADEKRKKDELKALKDQYDILLKEDEVQFERRRVIFDRALDLKTITESDHDRRELQVTVTHYENMIGIYNGYLSQLTKRGEEGGEEYLNIQKKILETEKKLSESRSILSRNSTVTKQLPGVQNNQGVTSQTGAALTTIQDIANVEKTVMANRFRDLVFGEQQLQIARLQVQKDAYDKQLAVLEEAGLKESKQYEQISKRKEQTDNELYKNKERLKDLEQQMEEAKMSLLNESFGFAVDILARDEAARKKNASAIKAFQTGQVITNGITEVSKIWAVHGANPILAGILTAAAVIRGVGAVAKIASTKFAGGGFTGSGSNYKDETGHTPVGVVHNDEWVGPKWMTQNPKLRPIFNMMENIRRNGYADGGFVSTTPIVNLYTPQYQTPQMDIGGLISEIQGLRNDVATWNSKLRAVVVRDELTAQIAQDEADRASSAL
jgi:tape measure domain-containing protein